ncbi:DUF1810 domain-containing protein [Asticcacaulis taihuensis]|uniref:Uncharacterized protein, DUF1810 family n=1 Tax=Asticcacaulis taihuensis TaxID=260084 RepID=A0A1G4SG61_9CAUL|nr:DUF1810 domain-containing protein [Asticcacaulis taihuensis]SCW68048.1 Uncharacterized protein, DUF1810 family [Asticcacaulis taihuensis]
MRPDHDLNRFVSAQAPVYAQALAELRGGRKTSHWMWFIFPQLSSLGRSARAQYYGISGLSEARAYLDHPLLGERLRACTRIVIDTQAASLHQIFGTPDDLKFCSSMTLFSRAAGDATLFDDALDRWCGGPDKATLRLLESA